jgi:hypothetical protein
MTSLRLDRETQSRMYHQQTEQEMARPFRFAFLALLALNVFLVAGGASFAFLYFTH